MEQIPREQLRAYVMGACDGDVATCDAVWSVLQRNETMRDAASSANMPFTTFQRLVKRVKSGLIAFAGAAAHGQASDERTEPARRRRAVSAPRTGAAAHD